MISKSKVAVTLLLLCASFMPLTIYQIGNVSGAKGGGGNGPGGGGGRPPPSGGSGSRPSQPIAGGGARPPGGGSGSPRPSQPIVSPPKSFPTMRPPISQPTVALPIATLTRPGIPSVSFSRSIFTGISFTRTIATSFTFAPTFTYMTTSYYPPYIGGCYNGYAGYYGNCAGGYYGFIQYPPSFDDTAGSFTLDQTLNNQNGVPCVYYTYFTFDAYAGQQLQAKIWTNGSPINYLVLPSSLISGFQQTGCGSGSFSQGQSFSSQATLNWTAAQNGEYSVVFYSTVPYNGPVYFQPT